MFDNNEAEEKFPPLPEDGYLLDLSDKPLVDSWCQYFGVEPEALIAVFRAVGPSVRAVKRYLGKE